SYSATKHGILGYLKAARAELRGTRVRLTAIMPSVVDTKLAEGTGTGAAKLLEPEAIAEVVVDAIGSRTFEITIPRYIGPLNRVINLLPQPLRDPIFGKLVPNQLTESDKSIRD